MSRKARYVVLINCSIILLGLAFYSGYYVGNQHAVTSALANIGIAALDNRTVLKMLESGDASEAMNYLNTLLDAEIVELYAYQAASSDAEMKNQTLDILRKIAEDRKSHPAKNNHASPVVEQKIKSILDSVLEVE